MQELVKFDSWQCEAPDIHFWANFQYVAHSTESTQNLREKKIPNNNVSCTYWITNEVFKLIQIIQKCITLRKIFRISSHKIKFPTLNNVVFSLFFFIIFWIHYDFCLPFTSPSNSELFPIFCNFVPMGAAIWPELDVFIILAWSWAQAAGWWGY